MGRGICGGMSTFFFVFIIFPAIVMAHNQTHLEVPHEIFQDIIDHAKKGELENVENGINLIKVLVDSLDSKYSEHLFYDIKLSINKHDTEKVIKAACKLIYLNIIDLFNSSIEEWNDGNIEKSSAILKSAYLNYIIISSVIREKNLDTDYIIRKNFFDTIQFVETEVAHKGQNKMVPGSPELKLRIEEIEKQIISFL